jgi:hypothetical protein
MTILGKLVVREATRAVRTAQWRRIRTLERELAQFSSAADRADLAATLDRYPDHPTEDIRTILERQTSSSAPSVSYSRPPRYAADLLIIRRAQFRG